MKNRWLWIATTLLMTFTVIAQDATCPTLQITALEAIGNFCGEQSANTLCFGSPTTSVTFTDDAANDSVRFSVSGDSIPLTSIDWFSTSSEANTWGTTRAFLQAYAPNSLQEQPATMVLFGNVMLFNQGTEGITFQTADVEVTSPQGANIRLLPSADARLIEPVMRGTILKATGLSDDSSWVQVYTDRDTVGWVSTIAISDGFIGLPTVSPDDEHPILIAPMQAFNFQSGISDAACDGVPSSGILLQASNGDSPTEFYINGVTLQLNGTAYLQAQPEAGMLVHITDGSGRIFALDGEEKINAGYVSRVLLEVDDDNNLQPIENPTVPLVYDYQDLVNLPIDLLSNPSRVGIDIYTLITPRPIGGESPIAGMALDAPCKFTVGQSGANIRSAPNATGSIIAVMSYRESAEPLGRIVGTDGYPWWKLAEGAWVRVDTTVTGGDCASVPNLDSDG